MSVLRSLENKIADLVEGAFGRAFPSARSRPVELARRLVREMDEHRQQSLSSTYVPNHTSSGFRRPIGVRFAPIEAACRGAGRLPAGARACGAPCAGRRARRSSSAQTGDSRSGNAESRRGSSGAPRSKRGDAAAGPRDALAPPSDGADAAGAQASVSVRWAADADRRARSRDRAQRGRRPRDPCDRRSRAATRRSSSMTGHGRWSTSARPTECA